MTHPLVDFFELARLLVRQARDTLNDCPWEEAFPPELRASFSALFLRTRQPQVQALVWGPLKAGKSTLLNVLAGDTKVSQISQIPAYPCFVEVRDVERDEQGRPLEPPRSSFFRSDGTAGPTLDQDEGHRLMERLLDDFIRGGNRHEIEFPRVVQRVPLPNFDPQIDLVLVDSPGLFFNRRIDEIFFGDPGGELSSPDLVETARRMHRESDVVILVLRPEQLFFQVVADFLRAFSRQSRMRIFILVNASTHSKTQENERIIDFDQVEDRQEIRKYFLRHVADEDLVREIEEGNRISLDFADLLEASLALFTPEGDIEAFGRTHSAEVVEGIRDYLFSQDLAQLKMEHLSIAIREALEAGGTNLSNLRLARSAEHLRLIRELDSLRPLLEGLEGELERMAAEKGELEEELRLQEIRQDAARLFLEQGELFSEPGDEVAAEFLSIHQTSPLPEQVEERLSTLTSKTAREIVDGVYRRWRSGEYGPRSLRMLAESLWESKLEGESRSLRSYSQEAVRECFREIVAQVRSTVQSEQLREAIDRIDPLSVEVTTVNPLLNTEPLPLLRFRSRWSLRLSSWRSAFRLRPRDLWGEDGERALEGGDEEGILYKERKNLLRQIWGPPWRLEAAFSPEHLQSVARRLLMSKICRSWSLRIGEARSRVEQGVAEIEPRILRAMRRLDGIRIACQRLEDDIRELDRVDEDLERRERILHRLSVELDEGRASLLDPDSLPAN